MGRKGKLCPSGLSSLGCLCSSCLCVASRHWFWGWVGMGSDTCRVMERLSALDTICWCGRGLSRARVSLVLLSQCCPPLDGKQEASLVLSPLVLAACCMAATTPSACGQRGGAGSASWRQGHCLGGPGQGWLTPCLSPNRRSECQTRGAVRFCSLPGACPALPSASDGVCGKDFGGGLGGFGGGSCLPSLLAGRAPASSPGLRWHLPAPLLCGREVARRNM